MEKLIVFNALQTSLSGGIGRYSYELAKQLYLQYPSQIKIVIRKEDKVEFQFVDSKDLIVVKGITNSKERNFYEQFKLPKLIAKQYPNAILHYPDTMAPIFAKNEVAITVHDLAFKSLKDVFTWKTYIWKNFITNLSIKKASKVIAITEFTKTEIAKYYPKYMNKVSVVYNGFNDFSKEAVDENNISASIKDIKKDYIVTVSTISPRKNIDGLIKAFNQIKDQIPQQLVVAGGNGWLYESVHDLVHELKLDDRVIFTGKINDDELKYLYKNATLSAYVSFYEGFGLPPLEAMSYNTPCVVSNTSSLPEVVGDYAKKVDPTNIDEISQALLDSLMSNQQSLNYKDWLANFSWEKCAAETYEFLIKIN